ncbi:MAG: FecR domain-containing protein [Proteobacteria bacterium]|nr:FecR domain-containing protein [Pseudomonadota bacterium]
MESAGDPATTMPRRASEWLLALHEAPDDAALRQRFDAWLSADPAHAVDWHEICRTSDALDHLQQAGDWRPVVFAAPRRRWQAVSGVAASMLLAALVIVAAPDAVMRLTADYATGTAEQRTVALSDGSMVRLAPLSAISVDFDDASRRVRLLKGEAFFEVTHEADRPFVVEASNVKATDLGTAFDVRVDPGGVDVAVHQGLVQVDAVQAQPAASERLEAGDWIRATTRQPVERGHLPVEEIGAWMRDRLIVKNQPVSEIVEALRPYFNGIIVLRGDELARRSMTGVYNLSNPVEALRAVAQAQGATVHRITPWLLILSGA